MVNKMPKAAFTRQKKCPDKTNAKTNTKTEGQKLNSFEILHLCKNFNKIKTLCVNFDFLSFCTS